MAFRLSGELNEQRIELRLGGPVHLLGSGPECDLRLQDPTISRRHVRLTVETCGVGVIDLDSKNGTFVDSSRISEQRLQIGQVLTLGRVQLLLEEVDERDFDVGLALDPASTLDDDRPAASQTSDAAPVAGLMVDLVPELLGRILAGADPVEIAQRAGSTLFERLPLATIEIADRGDDESEALLFVGGPQGTAAETAEGGVSVERTEGSLRARVELESGRESPYWVALLDTLLRLVRLARDRTRGDRIQPTSETPAPSLPEPLTLAPQLRGLYERAAEIGRADIGVLIVGESGTGKEVLAHYIHRSSPRSEAPFVAVNCAALPRDLLEAELFGIERGVATGVSARPGKFEQADGGTLFLDEVGDMALETQAMILRVLQEHAVHRIGSAVERSADVRIVAATHQDLAQRIEQGAFRQDLYFRIATFVARLPPLRQRAPDIPNLASHFVSEEAARQGKRISGISRAALEKLEAYDWPGNVRQLQNEMGRAVAFTPTGSLVDTTRLSSEVLAGPGEAVDLPLEQRLRRFERLQIQRVMELVENDVEAAAASLGISRATLYRRLRTLGIER